MLFKTVLYNIHKVSFVNLLKQKERTSKSNTFASFISKKFRISFKFVDHFVYLAISALYCPRITIYSPLPERNLGIFSSRKLVRGCSRNSFTCMKRKVITSKRLKRTFCKPSPRPYSHRSHSFESGNRG